MKHVSVTISFNISEKDFNSKVFKDFIYYIDHQCEREFKEDLSQNYEIDNVTVSKQIK